MGGITTIIINKVKYVGIACLSLAILSTLILNIISSYSLSKIESNAMDSNSEVSTLANDSSICDPTNTNAAACISLSITSSSSSSTDSNNPNLSLQIPREGGIAVGRHTVKVASNNVSGISVSLSVNSDGTASLVNVANPSWSIRSNEKISRPDPDILDNNRWGVALPMDQASAALYESAITNPEQASNLVFSGLPTKNNNEHALSVASNAHGDFTINTYYGVRVDRPENLLAGDYRADVVYTVVTNEVPMPTITSTSSDTYELGSGADGTVIITGTNLSSTYSVYLTNTNGDKIGDCTNLNVTSNTQITCTVPTDQTNPGLEAGDYTIHVVTQGGEGTIGFSYTKKTLPDGILESTDDYGEDGHVAVDYDENMIPVTYIGNETTPRWVIADPSNNNANDSLNWYNYPAKKWANAVTLTEEGLAKYKGQSVGTKIDEQYVLGYWVYIPRYAYKVMRKEVTDKVVTDDEARNNGKGGFEIVFETNSDVVKEPAACNNSNTNQYYQDCVKNQYGDAGINYPGNNSELNNKTAWATHPAFTWQYAEEINGFDKTYELNGFWIGKFDVTGSKDKPEILPGQSRVGSQEIGTLYDISESIGKFDQHNTGGNSTVGLGDNVHSLAGHSTHMFKNSEWGAMTYLSSSKFGSGINNILTPGNNYIYYRIDGVKSSTTGDVYGVYDVSHSDSLVAASISDDNMVSSTQPGVTTAIKKPYVDLYLRNPFLSTSWYRSANQYCTWEACGGQALYEISNNPTSDYGQWGDSSNYFMSASAMWLDRGVGDGIYGYYGNWIAPGYAGRYHVSAIPLTDNY